MYFIAGTSCPPPIMPNAFTQSTDVTSGTRRKYSCPLGTRFIDGTVDITIECVERGVWFPNHLDCRCEEMIHVQMSYDQISRNSTLRDMDLELFSRSETWQAFQQEWCRGACQISKGYDHFDTQFRGFENSRNLLIYNVPLKLFLNSHLMKSSSSITIISVALPLYSHCVTKYCSAMENRAVTQLFSTLFNSIELSQSLFAKTPMQK